MSTIKSGATPETNGVSEDLEFVAEALLALCAADRAAAGRSDARPSLSADALRLRERNDRLRARSLLSAAMGVGGDGLAHREFRAALSRASLTARQSEVLAARLAGERFDEIGARYGSSKQAAQAAFTAALVKLRRAWRAYPYAGFAEVYRAEVRRGRPARRERPVRRDAPQAEPIRLNPDLFVRRVSTASPAPERRAA